MKRGMMFFALAIILCGEARAAVARAVPFEEKVKRADDIVLARCIESHSKFDPSGRWIVTYSTFEVVRSYKGGASTTVTVVTPGGRVGSLHQVTVGVPSVREGDLNVIFVGSSSLGSTVMFLGQGLYRVEENDRGEQWVNPAVSDLVLLDGQTGKVSAPEAARPLSQFASEVSLVVRPGGGRLQR